MRAYVPNEQGWICSLLHKVRYLLKYLIIFVCMCHTFHFFLSLPSPICQGHKASPPWEGHNAKNSGLRFSFIFFFWIWHFSFRFLSPCLLLYIPTARHNGPMFPRENSLGLCWSDGSSSRESLSLRLAQGSSPYVITLVPLLYYFTFMDLTVCNYGKIHMGLHTLKLGTFPKPLEGKEAMKDVKECNNAYSTTIINISAYNMTLTTKTISTITYIS